VRAGKSLASVLVTPVLIASIALLSGCGDDDDGDDASSSATEAPSASTEDDGQNACPVDGCTVTISDVQKDGEELRITWEENFTPDFSKNHIHVFWDTYSADQVSDDAADRGVEQGEWVPTDEYPEFVTEGPVSTGARGDSTTLCVTAGDRDHIVIDSSLVDCFEVSELL
jgi:hypothetical protein